MARLFFGFGFFSFGHLFPVFLVMVKSRQTLIIVGSRGLDWDAKGHT